MSVTDADIDRQIHRATHLLLAVLHEHYVPISSMPDTGALIIASDETALNRIAKKVATLLVERDVDGEEVWRIVCEMCPVLVRP